MSGAVERFQLGTGWEPDYIDAGDPNLLIAGYRGPFPLLRDTRSTLATTFGPLLHERLGHVMDPRRSLAAVTEADRLLVAWATNGPAGLVTGRYVRIGDLSSWYLTTGVVAADARGRRLFERLVRRLIAEEPADVLAATTSSDAVHRTYQAVSAGRRVHPDDRSMPADVTLAFAADVVGEVLGDDAKAQLDKGMVRRGCYETTPHRPSAGELSRRFALGAEDGVVVLADLSGRLAARLSTSGRRPRVEVRGSPRVVAVTGTNGKTSVVEAGRQLTSACGVPSASHGTLGVVTERGRVRAPRLGSGATAVPELGRSLWECGVDVMWTEAFSYALGEGLLDGLPVDVAVFTQAGADHLGAHGSLAAYRSAKDRLFEVVVSPDGAVVVDPREPGADRVLSIARRRRLTTITTGPGQRVELTGGTLRVGTRHHPCSVPFPAAVMVRNLELAAGAALALGLDIDAVAAACRTVTAPPGRFEALDVEAPYRLVVDAAHNADALERSLLELRRETTGRLLVLVASVGTADPHRWETLGEVADALADVVVITDESPHRRRSGEIRAAIRRGCPRGIEIPSRRNAVDWIVAQAQPGDTVAATGRADEDFVVGPDGTSPYPTDAVLLRDAVAGRRSRIAPSTIAAIRSGYGRPAQRADVARS